MLGRFNKVLAAEAREDGTINDRLGRLREAAERGDTSELKKEAMSAVETIETILTQRRARAQEESSQLGSRIRDLARELEDVKRESALDPLTRLHNRGAFDRHLARTVEVCLLFNEPAALILVDLDRFKSINDSFGHPVGDAVIVEMTKQISKTFLRKSDFIARYGGEEFAIILRDTNLDGALKQTSKLHDAVRKTSLKTERGEVRFTFSAGVAMFDLGDSPKSWLTRADSALYGAKQGGRDRTEHLPPTET